MTVLPRKKVYKYISPRKVTTHNRGQSVLYSFVSARPQMSCCGTLGELSLTRQRQRDAEMLLMGSSSKISVGDGMGTARSRVGLFASAIQILSLQKAASPKQLIAKRPSSGASGPNA